MNLNLKHIEGINSPQITLVIELVDTCGLDRRTALAAAVTAWLLPEGEGPVPGSPSQVWSGQQLPLKIPRNSRCRLVSGGLD